MKAQLKEEEEAKAALVAEEEEGTAQRGEWSLHECCPLNICQHE